MSRQVASGIIQNNQLSAAAIEANKKKFAEEFTQRAEFRSLYDPLSNFDYVERLFQTTGISVSAPEKAGAGRGAEQSDGDARFGLAEGRRWNGRDSRG